MSHPSSSAPFALALSFLAILMTCMPSAAQNFQTLNPAVGHHGALVSPGARTLQEGQWIPRLTIGLADQPLVSQAPDQSVNEIFVDGQTGFDLGMAWGALDNLEVGLNMPFGVVDGDGLEDHGGPGFALGDLDVGVKWRISAPDGALMVAPDLWLSLPTGNRERFYGAKGMTIRPGLNATSPFQDVTLMGRIGLKLETEQDTLANIAVVNTFEYSLAALMDTDWSSVSFLAEIFGSVPVESADNGEVTYPVEGLLGLVFRAQPLEVTAGSAFAVNAEPGVPNHRVFLSVAFVPFATESSAGAGTERARPQVDEAEPPSEDAMTMDDEDLPSTEDEDSPAIEAEDDSEDHPTRNEAQKTHEGTTTVDTADKAEVPFEAGQGNESESEPTPDRPSEPGVDVVPEQAEDEDAGDPATSEVSSAPAMAVADTEPSTPNADPDAQEDANAEVESAAQPESVSVEEQEPSVQEPQESDAERLQNKGIQWRMRMQTPVQTERTVRNLPHRQVMHRARRRP